MIDCIPDSRANTILIWTLSDIDAARYGTAGKRLKHEVEPHWSIEAVVQCERNAVGDLARLGHNERAGRLRRCQRLAHVGARASASAGATRQVAIVTRLPVRLNAIAAAGRRTIAIATVSVIEVTIVARLSICQNVIAAAGRRTIAIATISVVGIAIVALLVADVLLPVTALRELANCRA